VRTIIAGSRDLDDPSLVDDAIEASGWRYAITEVVHGGCRGVDMCAGNWGALNGIPVKMFPADWKGRGLRAGPMRNEAMAGYADALIAVWDGESKGTKHMIQAAKFRGLKVYIHRVPA
jgi:hypothetical protein